MERNLGKELNNLTIVSIAVQGGFWKRYRDLVRETVIPYQWKALNDRVPDAPESRAVKNMKIAAGLAGGGFGGMRFADSDLAKWLEAAAWSLAEKRDHALEATADEIIEAIGRAQRPDGYLNTYYILKFLEKRWTNLKVDHELYCAGHLIEAAVAYFEATGKRRFLEIMCRYADHIDSVFGLGEGKKKGYPGHEEIELALVKLFRATSERRYLELAKYFLDERGKQPYYFDIEAVARGDDPKSSVPDHVWPNGEYYQSHIPVREQEDAVGHSVRAMYLYSGMADIARETGDKSLLRACGKLWASATGRRMYVTGGVGSSKTGEAFTFDYDLPNDIGYAETCAAIGLVFFARRMLELEPDRKYADVMERALYNASLSGMSTDGTRYLYVNPLEVIPEASEKSPVHEHVKHVRQSWYRCACCPPNIARLIASIDQYLWTVKPGILYAQLYYTGEIVFDSGAGEILVSEETGYPWDCRVNFRIEAKSPAHFTLALRIPGWCRAPELAVAGKAVDLFGLLQNGYAKIDRVWAGGDTVELVLPMPVERIYATSRIREDLGKVAIQRGPILYCLEEADNGPGLHTLFLPRDVEFSEKKLPDLPKEAVALETQGLKLAGTPIDAADGGEAEGVALAGGAYGFNPPTEAKPRTLTFIPYYTWANRTPGEMLVWIHEKP